MVRSRKNHSVYAIFSIISTLNSETTGIINLAQLMLNHSLVTAKVIRTTSGVVLQSQHGKRIDLVFTSKKGRGKRKGGRGDSHNTLMRGGLPLPSRLTVRTRFQKTVSLNNAGVNFANVRFSPVFCYDVDPTIGSTSMPFFAEVMTLYRFYRTVKSHLRVEFCNQENALPHTAYICPVNFDPGANTATFQNFLSNPNSKSVLLGEATGQARGTLTHTATTNAFAGSRWNGDSDNYTGSATGSAPQNQWFWMIGTSAIAGMANGVLADITIDITFVAFEEASPGT